MLNIGGTRKIVVPLEHVSCLSHTGRPLARTPLISLHYMQSSIFADPDSGGISTYSSFREVRCNSEPEIDRSSGWTSVVATALG